MSEIALRKVSKKKKFVYVWLWKTPVYLLCFKVITKPSLENDLFTTAKDTNVTKISIPMFALGNKLFTFTGFY